MKNLQSQLDYHNIKTLCAKYNINDYTMNNDGSIDVDGNVVLSENSLTRIPLRFGKVSGNFWCYDNELSTLWGCPNIVGGDFRCSTNRLTTLEYAPKIVEGSFFCSNNRLTNLYGCPEVVDGYFVCHNNLLTTLEGAPKEVQAINCEDNHLTTLDYCPLITSDIPCMFNRNKYAKIVGIELGNFKKENDKVNAFIKYQNHYEIWNDSWVHGLQMDNFQELIDEINDGLR